MTDCRGASYTRISTDANVLADADEDGVPRISGIVDLGDSLYGVRAAEVAIAAGYAMVRKADPLAAAAEVVAGFQLGAPPHG